MAVTRTTKRPVNAEEPLAPSTIVTVGHTHENYGDSFDTDEISVSIEELEITSTDEGKPQPHTNVKRQPDTSEIKPQPAPPKTVEELLSELEPNLPDLVAAVRRRSATFDHVLVAYRGRQGWTADKGNQVEYARIYPLVLKAFKCELVAFFPSKKEDIYVAITKRRRHWPFNYLQKAEFQFMYNLAKTPVAAETILRINQLAYDARRILDPKALDNCLNELYSAATDLVVMIESHKHSKKKSDPTEQATEQAKIAYIRGNLDEMERRYLQVAAQFHYFGGVIVGTAVAALGIVSLSTLARFDSVSVVATMLAAIGATISVLQKMSDDALTIKYDVGWFYVMFRGAIRPIIGSIAALLLLLAITAGLIPLSKGGGALAAYILLAGFAIGWAERAIPDIFTRAGLQGGLPPATT